MSALLLKNLSRRFSDDAVGVRDLNIEVLEGELMVLVGPSGSGKSTTLRLIAGLETPTSGEVFIGGKLANNIPPRDRDIAMVFQDYALYPHLNVRQNLGFGLKMRGFPSREIDSRVMRASEMLGISDLMGRKPKELSGGQRQRVALGRALVRDPKVFLFDEPLSNLDASLRVLLRREIKEIHRTLGATMVYVTHDQSEAMTIGQRIAVMNAGSLEQVGPPSELYCRPASMFVAGFFGNPPMNFVGCSAEIKEDQLEIRPTGTDIVVRLHSREEYAPTSGRILLGFRPEDILVDASSPPDSLSGSAKVASVEALGAETILHLETNAFRPVARILGHVDIEPGTEVTYSVLQDKLHLFDAATNRRILT